MAAFHEAQRLGADGVEFDVQQCSDGALVVIHDFAEHDAFDRIEFTSSNVPLLWILKHSSGSSSNNSRQRRSGSSPDHSTLR